MTHENLGLFEMEELNEIGNSGLFTANQANWIVGPEYRVVEEETGIVMSEKFGSRVPWELRDLSSTGAMAEFLDNLKNTDNLSDKVNKIQS